MFNILKYKVERLNRIIQYGDKYNIYYSITFISFKSGQKSKRRTVYCIYKGYNPCFIGVLYYNNRNYSHTRKMSCGMLNEFVG